MTTRILRVQCHRVPENQNGNPHHRRRRRRPLKSLESFNSRYQVSLRLTRHDDFNLFSERRGFSTSTSTSSSSSSSTTPTPTPQSPVPQKLHQRRSVSPPLAPMISANNGRPVHQQPPPPATTNNSSQRAFDERRYSPDALERQLNAELHLLDGVEASMKQVDNMERLRSVALAQQEVVSLAQVLQNVTFLPFRLPGDKRVLSRLET